MNNNLDRILFVQPKDRHSGAGLLILNDTLPVVGRVLQFKSEKIMYENLERFHVIDRFQEQVAGYNIVISYTCILGRPNSFPRSSYASQISQALMEMAHWYLQNKIKKHTPHWKRYKQTI